MAEINQLEEENEKIKQSMVDIQARSMRDNLIFTNIAETGTRETN